MKRRKAREHALQILFQLDLRKEKPSAASLRRFWTEFQPEEDVKAFAEEIIKGTYKHLPSRIVAMSFCEPRSW